MGLITYLDKTDRGFVVQGRELLEDPAWNPNELASSLVTPTPTTTRLLRCGS